MFHPGIVSRLGEILPIMVRSDNGTKTSTKSRRVRLSITKASTLDHLSRSSNGEQSDRSKRPHCVVGGRRVK